MLESTNIDIFNLFLFVIPGFITVWSFRYVTEPKKDSNFEYFALSVFWGLLLLTFNRLIAPLLSTQETFNRLLQNVYAAALAFSFFGFFLGLAGGLLIKGMWAAIEHFKARKALENLRR